jgi:hypothetical protein
MGRYRAPGAARALSQCSQGLGGRQQEREAAEAMDGQPPTDPWAGPGQRPSADQSPAGQPATDRPYGSPQGGDGGAYGQQPPGAYGGGYRQPPQPPTEQPRTIRIAVALMFVGAALSFFGLIASFSQTEEMEEMIAEEFPSLTEDEVDTAVSQGQAQGVVGGLVGVGLWIWMAIANGQGKNWARITGTVFGGIHIVTVLIFMAVFPMPSLTTALSLASITLAGIIVILMFLRESSDYYDAMSRKPYPAYGGYGYRPY